MCHSLTHSLTDWQRHLLSCPGQLKKNLLLLWAEVIFDLKKAEKRNKKKLKTKKSEKKTCCCCGRMWSLVFHSGARAGWSCSSLPGFFVSELIGYFKWYLLPVTILLKNYYLKWCSKTHIYFVCFYSPPHSRHFVQCCWRPTPWSCTPWTGGDHSLQNETRQILFFGKSFSLFHFFHSMGSTQKRFFFRNIS